MKRLNRRVLKIILFVLFIFLSDKFIGKILNYAYLSSDDITISKIRYTLNKTCEEILIFGASTAQHHYIPDTISRGTGFTVYNCGIGGQGLAFSLVQISETLKRYKPQIIILDVAPLIRNDKDNDPRLKILSPYYHDNIFIRDILNNNGPRFERLKYLFSIYPYNSMLYDLFLALFYIPHVSIKGYIPLSGTMQDANLVRVEESEDIHEIPEKQIKYLQMITNLCYKNKVDLWIIISPIYKTTKADIKIIQELRDFAEQEHVRFLDFSQNENFSEHLLFRDNVHLNSNGASRFSSIVRDSILCHTKKF